MDLGQPQLTPRQEAILVRVVEEYVETVVERTGLDVSSSTVRYELAQLEEFGFLSHPHTSAGRVPTDLGYRFFVDRVIESVEPRSSDAELGLDLSQLKSEVDSALQVTTDALAEMTHLLALVSAPPLQTTAVRRVEVIVLQPQLILVVVITVAGGVMKQLFSFAEPVDPGLAEWASEYLNERISGLQLGARRSRAPSWRPEIRSFR